MLQDVVKKVGEGMDKWRSDQTPADGNICKAPCCGGRVVAKVAAVSRGRYSYHTPACEKCGRSYCEAVGCHKVGEKEFRAKMDERVTI